MFKENIDALCTNLEKMISTKTVIGEPIVLGNVTMIPVVEAKVGFGTGTGEGNDPTKGAGKGSGGGAGASVKATAMVVVHEGEVKVYSLGKKGMMEQLAEMIPEIMAKHGKSSNDCCGG
ncbi:MAG: GerW family sporulation protein [Candidatus Saccharibacteria bacterium]